VTLPDVMSVPVDRCDVVDSDLGCTTTACCNIFRRCLRSCVASGRSVSNRVT